jgi:AmmeMemoRadiSam system protein A
MTEQDKKKLLDLARQTIIALLRGEASPALPVLQEPPTKLGGAFVTLRSGHALRGCIGRFNPPGDLAEAVREMAVSALGDPRFQHTPVRLDELAGLRIEISVLSPMVRTSDPLSLALGEHGIYIRRGTRSGCFLPQVATEQHWDRETFLSYCCEHKAGLPADAWKFPDTEVYLFGSEMFEEE